MSPAVDDRHFGAIVPDAIVPAVAVTGPMVNAGCAEIALACRSPHNNNIVVLRAMGASTRKTPLWNPSTTLTE